MSRQRWKDHGATFSPCRRWRYTLWRIWGKGTRLCTFIGLNPSTADEVNNDPTVTRCINFAKRWDFDGMIMLNIFAYRSTDPRWLYKVDDPVGMRNDYHILKQATRSAQLVACWGAHGEFRGRGNHVRDLLFPYHPIRCFGRTKSGQPKHPLYLPSNTALELFVPRL